MDPHIRASIQTNTFYYFIIILFMTTVSQLATMITIVFADISGKENLIAITIVGSAFIGAFGIIRMMTNMKLIASDMDDKMSETNYGKELQNIPFHILRFIFAGVFIIIAIVQLITIYWSEVFHESGFVYSTEFISEKNFNFLTKSQSMNFF